MNDKELYNRAREEARQTACKPQKHVHEITGSTEIAERCEDPHNHRFATVSDEAITRGNSHVHKVKFRTDFYEEHYHEFYGESSIAIPVGDNRHVHYLKADTDESDCHKHDFRVATLIENPIETDCDCDCDC